MAALAAAEAAGAVRAAVVHLGGGVDHAQPEAARVVAEPKCPVWTCEYRKGIPPAYRTLEAQRHESGNHVNQKAFQKSDHRQQCIRCYGPAGYGSQMILYHGESAA